MDKYDIIESNRKVLKSLKYACDIFSSLFGEVSPIEAPDIVDMTSSSSSNDKLVLHSSLSMSLNAFTPSQREHVKYLSGHLLSAIDTANQTHLLLSTDNPDIQSHIKSLEDHLHEREKDERRDLKKIRALQDYLVHELTRNQELEEQIQQLEAKITNIEDEKRKYMRKISRLTSMNADKVIAIDEIVGKYVMKKFENEKFFGLIVGFKNPYFQVVYEDDDKEEMDFKEVNECIWNDSVPSMKANRIKNYAEAFCLQHGIVLKDEITSYYKLEDSHFKLVLPDETHFENSGSPAISYVDNGDMLEMNNDKDIDQTNEELSSCSPIDSQKGDSVSSNDARVRKLEKSVDSDSFLNSKDDREAVSLASSDSIDSIDKSMVQGRRLHRNRDIKPLTVNNDKQEILSWGVSSNRVSEKRKIDVDLTGASDSDIGSKYAEIKGSPKKVASPIRKSGRTRDTAKMDLIEEELLHSTEIETADSSSSPSSRNSFQKKMRLNVN